MEKLSPPPLGSRIVVSLTMHRKAVLPILICLMFFTSCTVDPEVMSALDAAESVMEDSPETALSILEGLDRSLLVSREATARYSLLYSQALDKNWIDVTTDSIIRPAVEYYARHGSADERLKAQYYLGCVYMNAGEFEKAMECYVRAEQYVEEAVDYQAVGRLYSAKRNIYSEYYDLERAYDDGVKSAIYYEKSGDEALQAKALSRSAEYAMLLDRYHDADSLLSIVENQLLDSLSAEQKGVYYDVAVYMAAKQKSPGVRRLLREYCHVVPSWSVEWGTVADTYRLLGDVDSAKWALGHYSQTYPEPETSVQYLLLTAMLYGATEDYDTAYAALEKYTDIVGREDMRKFNSDTKYIEERYEHELSALRQSKLLWIVVSCFCIAILVVSITLLVMRDRLRKRSYDLEVSRLRGQEASEKNLRMEREAQLQRLREKSLEHQRRSLEELNRSLESERDALEAMLHESSLSQKARKAIEDRLSAVAHLIAETAMTGNVSGNIQKRVANLVSDKNEFVLDTMMSYAAVHPKFVKYLKEHGLTDWEAGYCCFYAMGLRGTDVGNMLNNGGHSHHNRASVIRAKLGLKERDGHLGRYLVKKLREVETDAGEEES